MTVDSKVEAEIDALLGRDDTASVIDTLLAMPRMRVADNTDETWEKILHARLQARLARKMRETLEGTNGEKDERNAA